MAIDRTSGGMGYLHEAARALGSTPTTPAPAPCIAMPRRSWCGSDECIGGPPSPSFAIACSAAIAPSFVPVGLGHSFDADTSRRTTHRSRRRLPQCSAWLACNSDIGLCGAVGGRVVGKLSRARRSRLARHVGGSCARARGAPAITPLASAIAAQDSGGTGKQASARGQRRGRVGVGGAAGQAGLRLIDRRAHGRFAPAPTTLRFLAPLLRFKMHGQGSPVESRPGDPGRPGGEELLQKTEEQGLTLGAPGWRLRSPARVQVREPTSSSAAAHGSSGRVGRRGRQQSQAGEGAQRRQAAAGRVAARQGGRRDRRRRGRAGEAMRQGGGGQQTGEMKLLEIAGRKGAGCSSALGPRARAQAAAERRVCSQETKHERRETRERRGAAPGCGGEGERHEVGVGDGEGRERKRRNEKKRKWQKMGSRARLVRAADRQKKQ